MSDKKEELFDEEKSLKARNEGMKVGAFQWRDKVEVEYLKFSGSIAKGAKKKVHPTAAKVLETKGIVKILNWKEFEALQTKRVKDKEAKEELKGKQPRYQKN